MRDWHHGNHGVDSFQWFSPDHDNMGSAVGKYDMRWGDQIFVLSISMSQQFRIPLQRVTLEDRKLALWYWHITISRPRLRGLGHVSQFLIMSPQPQPLGIFHNIPE